jgi:hypothetical protein
VQLFDELPAETVNCCGIFGPNTREVLRVLDSIETSSVTYRVARAAA